MTATAALVGELESAKHAQKMNDLLRRSVADAQELAGRTASQSFTSKRRGDVERQHKKLCDTVAEYQSSCAVHRFFDPQTFLSECEQATPQDRLINKTMKGEVESLQHLQKQFKALQSKKESKPFQPFLEEAIGAMDKSLMLLIDTAQRGAGWARIPDPLLMLLSTTIDQMPTSECVEEHEEQLKRMTFAVDECTQQQQQAVIDGDMKQTEVLYFKKITLQEAMVDVFNKMYNLLDAHQEECFMQPMKQVHEVHKKANGDISAVMQQNEDLRALLEEDLRRLNSCGEQLREVDTSAQAQFKAFCGESDALFTSNLQRQQDILLQIQKLEQQLVSVSEERAVAVQQRVDAVEMEQKRRADYDNFKKFQKDRTELLETTIQNCEVADEVTDIFDELLCNGCNAMEQRLREIDGEIEAVRQNVHEERLKHFRGLYLTIGDLQYKKGRNVEELEKKIQHTHIQQELAMETFNPKAKEYSQMKKDLLQVKDEMDSQVNVLTEKATLHIEAFKPTECALIEAGKQFKHPVEELQEMNEKRQTKLLEYQNLMSQESAEGGSNGEAAAIVANFDADAELRAIEELKASAQRAPHSSQGQRRKEGGGTREEGDLSSSSHDHSNNASQKAASSGMAHTTD